MTARSALLVAFFLAVGPAEARKNKDERRSNVEGMIAVLRERARAGAVPNPGEADSPHDEARPRPLTEPGAGEPCAMPGLVVRREMGNLGVTAFQVALAGLVLDALGPTWSYFDDWPRMAEYLKPDRHLTTQEADEMRARCRRKVTINPTEQEDLSLVPFNITDGAWVRTIREKVCGKFAPWNRGNPAQPGDNACIVLKIQNHWQHAAFYYRCAASRPAIARLRRTALALVDNGISASCCCNGFSFDFHFPRPFRYRDFLRDHVFRSATDLRHEYVATKEPDTCLLHDVCKPRSLAARNQATVVSSQYVYSEARAPSSSRRHSPPGTSSTAAQTTRMSRLRAACPQWPRGGWQTSWSTCALGTRVTRGTRP